MQKTLTVLRDRYDVKTTTINFMAVSLGALEGAYLSVIDADEGKIGISKYLLVNPPVDLAYAVRKIDEWNALAGKFGRDKSRQIVAKAIAIVDSFSEGRRDNPAVFDRLAKKFADFTTENLQFLIAENLQSQLRELVYVTQAISRSKGSYSAETRQEKTAGGRQTSHLRIITKRSLCPYGKSKPEIRRPI